MPIISRDRIKLNRGNEKSKSVIGWTWKAKDLYSLAGLTTLMWSPGFLFSSTLRINSFASSFSLNLMMTLVPSESVLTSSMKKSPPSGTYSSMIFLTSSLLRSFVEKTISTYSDGLVTFHWAVMVMSSACIISGLGSHLSKVNPSLVMFSG